MKYETDILISEKIKDNVWIPRVVIEAKINRITTHDAITYSQKSESHKNVHPYLRYGIILGNRNSKPLPGRLFRHGSHFDFILTLKKYEPEEYEISKLEDIIKSEVKASRDLEEMIFNSRRKNRIHYYSLHKPLILKEQK